MGMLSMRILTSSGKIYLDYIVHKVAEEYEARKIRFAGSNPGESARQTGEAMCPVEIGITLSPDDLARLLLIEHKKTVQINFWLNGGIHQNDNK